MKKGINTNKAMIRTLAVFLAIFGLTALSIAGLLEYYASAVASITVSQGVVVKLYNASNLIATLSHNSGSSPEVTLTATGVGGGKTENFYYNGTKIDEVKIEYLGNAVDEAPLTIELTLGNNFTGLFSEIVKYGVTIGSTTYIVKNDGVCVGAGGTVNCNSWNSNNQVTFDQITVTRGTKELTVTGLKLTPSNSQLTIDNLYVVWNPATAPGEYQLTVTVLPA